MRILLLADIHIGSIKDISYVYNTLTDIYERELIFNKTDMVVILGDYFHRLFKVNEDYVSCAINAMSYLIRACKRNNTKIRIVYGTESHEMGQYKLFNYHFSSSSLDIKLFDTVGSEIINGKRILYLPEEYMLDKHKFYDKYLYNDNHYDYIFGHGIIEEGMASIIKVMGDKTNNEKSVPRFKIDELESVSNLCIFGHYHIHTDISEKTHYLGSTFRDSFGEESDKGYGIIENDEFQFIINKNAYVYKTYEFTDQDGLFNDINKMISIINNIKQNHADIFNGEKFGRIRIIITSNNVLDQSFKESLKNIIFNDRNITLIIKEKVNELIEEVQDDVPEEYNFILDQSLPIQNKIYQYIMKKYDTNMTEKEFKHYLGGII